MDRDKENKYTLAVKFSVNEALVAYKTAHMSPCILDRSGGYGQISIPLVMVWSSEDRRWLIGHEARDLMDTGGVLIEELFKGCCNNAAEVIEGKRYAYVDLLVLFIELLTQDLLLLNPKASLEALRLLYPKNLPGGIQEAITGQSEKALKVICQLVTSVEAGAAWAGHLMPDCRDQVLWINYEKDLLEAFTIMMGTETYAERVLTNTACSITEISKSLEEALEKVYCDYKGTEAMSTHERQMIREMVPAYLPHMFKKQREKLNLKVTFNEVYPPFQSVLTFDQLTDMTEPYYSRYDEVMGYLLQHHKKAAMVLTGAGFRLQWPMTHLQSMTGKRHVFTWEGEVLGMLLHENEEVKLQGEETFLQSIGVLLTEEGQEVFYPLALEGDRIQGFIRRIELIIEQPMTNVELVALMDNGNYEPILSSSLQVSNEENISLIALTMTMEDQTLPSLKIEYLTL